MPTLQRRRRGRRRQEFCRAGPHRFSPQGAARARAHHGDRRRRPPATTGVHCRGPTRAGIAADAHSTGCHARPLSRADDTPTGAAWEAAAGILPGRTTPVQSAGRRARTAGPAGTQRRPTVAADSRPPLAEPGCPLTNGSGVGGGRRFLAGQDHTSHFNVSCFGYGRAGPHRFSPRGAARARRVPPPRTGGRVAGRPHATGRAGVPTGQRGRRGRLGQEFSRAGPHRFSPQGAARARRGPPPRTGGRPSPQTAGRHWQTAGVSTVQRGRRGRRAKVFSRAGPHRFSPQGAARARRGRPARKGGRPSLQTAGRHRPSRGAHSPTGAAWEAGEGF